jgi:RHH-type rel operon transcriptional repressor/antitoxin RelB
MSIAIRLSDDLEQRLTNLAQKTHRSKSSFVREAIENQIEDLEDYYLAMSVINNSDGDLYSIEEVEKLCGLDDKV